MPRWGPVLALGRPSSRPEEAQFMLRADPVHARSWHSCLGDILNSSCFSPIAMVRMSDLIFSRAWRYWLHHLFQPCIQYRSFLPAAKPAGLPVLISLLLLLPMSISSRKHLEARQTWVHIESNFCPNFVHFQCLSRFLSFGKTIGHRRAIGRLW